jgi:mono/diheme cytochrome c family protein
MHKSDQHIPAYTQAPRLPKAGRLPNVLIAGGLAVAAAAVLALAIAARARVSISESPRVQPIQDMAEQPKFTAQSANSFFEDGRAMRTPVNGTVARGHADEDDHYHRGFSTVTTGVVESQVFFDGFPDRVKVTPELMARGAQRFNIYCAVCHGTDGSGTGPVHRRATELAALQQANWTPPADLRSDAVRVRPEGHLYNTINMGIRNMPAHGPQIPVADRWAIVAWVRALQLKHQAATRPAVATATTPPTLATTN